MTVQPLLNDVPRLIFKMRLLLYVMSIVEKKIVVQACFNVMPVNFKMALQNMGSNGICLVISAVWGLSLIHILSGIQDGGNNYNRASNAI